MRLHHRDGVADLRAPRSAQASRKQNNALRKRPAGANEARRAALPTMPALEWSSVWSPRASPAWDAGEELEAKARVATGAADRSRGRRASARRMIGSCLASATPS